MARKAAPWFRKSTGAWYVTFQGKQTRLPVTDPKDVAGAWDAFRTLVSTAIEQKNAGRPEPVGTLIADYLASRARRVSPKTLRDYGYSLNWLNARFGNRAAGEIDPEAVENAAHDEKWSDSHKANRLWDVQAFIRWCGRKDFTLRRPSKESRGAETVISESLYRRILAETKGDFYQLIRLLWCVGSRPMESGKLTAEMIDWTSGTVTWKEHKTKWRTGRARVLYLNSEALTILREQVDKHKTGPLFRGINGQPLTVKAVMYRMIRLSKRLGVHVTAGHFRHTFATRALAAGIPDVQVAALLGHTSTAMIHKHYGHIHSNARMLREQAEKLAG